MKSYRYERGHIAGETMTVAELTQALGRYPPDMPVFASWEGVHAYVRPENLGVQEVDKSYPANRCPALVIGVDDN